MAREETISPTIHGQRPTARAAIETATNRPRSLYIHVPFCFHKCHYCDFYSFVDSRDRQPAFTEALERELVALAPFAGPVETIFIGGGTPTLLRPDLWRRLLQTLRERYDLSRLREFTVECNPETAASELFDVLAAGGVDRLSVGAQSFETRHLETLERWHEPRSVGRALELARSAGITRRSLDLIYAIPGQTLEEWEHDLRTAIALGVDHLSAYALTYEPNTAMAMRLKRGDIAAAPEELEATMQQRAVDVLADAGLERYEVSNFARLDGPGGGRSLHNLAYWRGESWLAAGPSASGHLRATTDGWSGGWRWKNVPRLTDWMDAVEQTGWSPVVDLEAPDPARGIAERIMLGLRLSEGIDALRLERAAARIDRGNELRAAVEAERRAGRVTRRGDRLVLSSEGWLFADGVAAELMASVSGDENL